MKKIIIIIVSVFNFLLLGCCTKPEAQIKKNIISVKDSVFSKLTPKKDTVKAKLQKKKVEIDDYCLGGKMKQSKPIPNKALLEAIKTRNLKLFLKNVDKYLYTSYEEYSSNKDLFFNYWNLKSKNGQGWTFLDRMFSHGGYYDYFNSDTLYISPIYASKFPIHSYCDNKLVTIRATYIYAKRNRLSEKLIKIDRDKVLIKNKTYYKKFDKKLDNQINNTGFEFIPYIFDKDIWHYIPKYKGYINAADVWSSDDVIAFLKRDSGKWILYRLRVGD